jgi:hypothetical protein
MKGSSQYCSHLVRDALWQKKVNGVGHLLLRAFISEYNINMHHRMSG